MCHAIFVEGALAAVAVTAALNGFDPLMCEGLLFGWWLCGTYTGLVRQTLQKKYHLKNSPWIHAFGTLLFSLRCALCQEHRRLVPIYYSSNDYSQPSSSPRDEHKHFGT
ncbi:hypothetical protein Leryth_017422 [Lithospermum erythrorhizon]|nr:hypothetical protein Leryth_017422 [Lithospermum erythrorhizon]